MSFQSTLSQTSIMQSFSILPDPRKTRNQVYNLFELVSVAILGILCGADDWVEVSLWAESNRGWLNETGICHGDVPSHDTLSRFFRFVNPLAFEGCFINWTQKIATTIGGVIALDGKTLSNSKNDDTRAIHLVSAFAAENQIVLGQLATQAKSNEITAFPLLIEMLDLRQAIVTIDAAGCQKNIAQQIREKGGDYVLAVKGNQPTLHNEAENFFAQAIEVRPEEADCDYYCSEEKSRSRLEKREIWVTDRLDWLGMRDEWKDLKSLVCLKSCRSINGKTSTELRYYISSLTADAAKHAHAVRQHWTIENNLHWQLDVSYGEDGCKVRKDHGAENFSILRRATLNMLKQDKKTKAGIKNKRSKAGWNREYMIGLLNLK